MQTITFSSQVYFVCPYSLPRVGAGRWCPFLEGFQQGGVMFALSPGQAMVRLLWWSTLCSYRGCQTPRPCRPNDAGTHFSAGGFLEQLWVPGGKRDSRCRWKFQRKYNYPTESHILSSLAGKPGCPSWKLNQCSLPTPFKKIICWQRIQV